MSQNHWRDTLYEVYSKLVEIKINNLIVSVPENNKLLRCFQFLYTDAISMGDYCWNGDCVNCHISYEAEDQEVKSALACKMYVKQGLVITELSENLKQDLAD